MVPLFLSAVFFAVGGLLMKVSEGATRPLPTVAFCTLFVAGALLQAIAMRRADLGVVYIAVLGLEAAIAFAISVGVLKENASPSRVGAVLLIVLGVILLRKT